MSQDTASNKTINPRSGDHAVPLGARLFLRELRYLVGIVIAAAIFLWVGTHSVPAPELDGTLALSWGPAVSGFAAGAILAALVLALAVGTLVTWCDMPHAGLFIANAGLMALAVRWGGVQPLLLDPAASSGVFHNLLLQCGFWLIFILLGEVCCRLVFAWFSRHQDWPALLGVPGAAPWRSVGAGGPGFPSTGRVLLAGAKSAAEASPGRWLDQVAGFLLTGLLAGAILATLLQSQDVGQVLFACFAAFFVATFATGRTIPGTSTWSLWLAVPATAAAGYLLAASPLASAAALPGQVPRLAVYGWPIYLVRGLPIAYVAAGMTGAILGFYAALRSSYHRILLNGSQWPNAS